VIHADGILFDLDGTLVDSDAAIGRCWRRWAAMAGVELDAFLPTVHGRQSHEVMAELLPGRSPALNQADHERMLRWEVEDTEGVVPIPGARELLAALDGVPWGIVTSCSAPLAAARLDSVGITPPDVLVTAEQVRRGKPDPEGFVRGAGALGLDPARCVAFEDASAGVAAARAAGMTVVGVGSRVDPGQVAFRVSTLLEVTVTLGERGVEVETLSPAA
jgi:mannitol-1-/sugar-/sorbitol-6-phosphatase